MTTKAFHCIFRRKIHYVVPYISREILFRPKEVWLNTALDGHARRKAAKRAEILAAAVEVFFEEGYARTSMDRIIDRIGGSKRTIYSYFPSKEDLFKAIVTDATDRVLAALSPPLDNEDLRQNLITMSSRYIDVLLSHECLGLFRAVVSEAQYFPEQADLFYERGPQRIVRHLAVFFRKKMAEGVIHVGDPELIAEQFLGMVLGDVLYRAALSRDWRPSKREIRRRVEQAVEIFLSYASPNTRGE